MTPSPLIPPTLRADLPVYPPLIQTLRVTATQVTGPSGVAQLAGSSVLGPMLYVAFTQQIRTDSLLPRDREPCLVDSVNGTTLTPGFYLGRLSGSFNSLPVYAVTAIAGPAGPSGGGGSFIAREVDGTPTTSTILKLPNTSLTDNGDGTVTVKPASATETGFVDTAAQSYAGVKTFLGNGVDGTVVIGSYNVSPNIYTLGVAGSQVINDGYLRVNRSLTGFIDTNVGDGALVGDTVSGSPIITNIYATLLSAGMPIDGANIPWWGAYIVSIDSSTQITISENATTTEVGATLQFPRSQITSILSSGFGECSLRFYHSTTVSGGNFCALYDSGGEPRFAIEYGQVIKKGLTGTILYGGTSTGGIVTALGAALTASSISDFNEAAQDAVGTIFTDSATIDFTYTDGTPSITADAITQLSITADGSGLKLSGDVGTPGNDYLYGTDAVGTKGWRAIPFTTVSDSATIDLTLTGLDISAAVITQLSITADGSGIKLDGDSGSPGNSYYYGTNSSGTKGFYTLPPDYTADPELNAIAGLTSAADLGIMFTGSGTAATYSLTAAGLALLDDADATAQRATLGLGALAVLNAATDVDPLTDSTGGTPATTLVDVTTAALADPVKCNDNFASLNTKVSEIITVLQTAGIMAV